jgi:(E)-4-hydroxy-3-methylbut-2-enyl-diphosphate synthase
VGGGAPVSVQSMTKTHTEDVDGTLAQIGRLAEAGCDIVRCAVPTEAAARALAEVVAASPLPVVADIHFSHRLALAALEAGVAKIRLNPGNLRRPELVRRVAAAARERGVPIRVGVNSGSLPPGEGALPERMVEGALGQCRLLEEAGFEDLVVSLKASDAATTVAAYRLAAARCDYPLHLGVTAAGPPAAAVVKSAVAIGTLLCEGIGDTVRVSVTGPPEDEVACGLAILEAAGLRQAGIEILSCPTCGRCRTDLRPVVEAVDRALAGRKGPVKVAVMGCEVNGPGEAREADVGLAAGKGGGWIFAAGRKLRKVAREDFVRELVKEVDRRSGEA